MVAAAARPIEKRLISFLLRAWLLRQQREREKPRPVSERGCKGCEDVRPYRCPWRQRGIPPGFAHLGLHGLGIEGPADGLSDDRAELCAFDLRHAAAQQLIPERFLALLQVSKGGFDGRNRRLAKDFENPAETLATFVTLASIQLALRRLARA